LPPSRRVATRLQKSKSKIGLQSDRRSVFERVAAILQELDIEAVWTLLRTRNAGMWTRSWSNRRVSGGHG
jgi:hypothetical protein